jgi:hypothetical protein
MPNSIRKITNNNTNTGMLKNGIAEVRNSQANDIRILTRECPANIFANKRIPRLTARAI